MADNGPPLDSLSNALFWLARLLGDVAYEADFYGGAFASFGGIGVPLATFCFNISISLNDAAQAVLRGSTYARAIETFVSETLALQLFSDPLAWVYDRLTAGLGIDPQFFDDPDGWVARRFEEGLLTALENIRDGLYLFLQRLLRYFLEGVFEE